MKSRNALLRALRPIASVVSVLLLLITLCFLGYAAPIWHHVREWEARSLITKIEAYKASHHEAPDDLTALGLPEDEWSTLFGVVWYKKLTRLDYAVWFALNTESSDVYLSKTKMWMAWATPLTPIPETPAEPPPDEAAPKIAP